MQRALDFAGLKVADLEQSTGMSRQTLSRWMNDRGAPPRELYVRHWAQMCGVSFVWLQTGESPRTGGPDGGEVRRQGLEPRTR